MPAQMIVWIVLPNGVEDRAGTPWVKFSAMVSPRLDPTGGINRLAPTFPDFTDWPDLAALLKFELEIQGVGTRLAEVISAKPDPELWAKLFRKGDVPLQPFVFKDLSKRALRSFPVRGVTKYVRDLYRDLGMNAGAALPKMPFAPGANTRLAALANELGDVVDGQRRKEHEATVTGALAPGGAAKPRALPPNWTNPQFTTKAQADFFLADRFYARPEFRHAHLEKPDLAQIPARPKKPELDFHQIVAALADHPQLLRRLGLVIDLATPAANVPALSSIRLNVSGPFKMATKHGHPWTRCLLDKDGFFAAPRGTLLEAGQIKLTGVSDQPDNEKAAYDVVTLDANGAALKTLHFAQTMRRLKRRSDATYRQLAYSTPEDGGAAALQSGGVALVENGRAFALATHLLRQGAVNQSISGVASPPNTWGDPHVLFAEDLLRGYRADVLDQTAGAKWRSLMQRVATYTLDLPGGIETLAGIQPDEGYVKAASAASKDTATSDMYLHEAIFSWTGWSLVAARPGNTIEAETTPGEFTQRERIKKIENKSAGDTPLAINAKAAPGSLPRLRFGHTYRLRVRIVDLVGNSVKLDLADESRATLPFTYRRYEPVTPPMLLPRAAFGEGASLERMVIRSNFDQTTNAYVVSAPVQAALAGKHFTYGAQDDRHVVPPKTSQLQAETHGLFDAQMSAGPAGIASAFRVAAKEAGTYLDARIVDTATGLPTIDVAASLQLVTPPGVPASPPPVTTLPLKQPTEDDPVGERFSPGQYVVHPPAQLHLPYLPDPIARGVTLRGVPNTPVGPIAVSVAAVQAAPGIVALKLPFDQSWPDAKPFRLVLRERQGTLPPPGSPGVAPCQQVFSHPGKAEWDAAARTLTVFLGKGETARILYSCYLDKPDVELMAVWRWIAGATNEAQLRALVEAGCHWMFTPYRELHLVHAVQQPLCAPRFERLAAQKEQVGDTHAYLRGVQVFLSAKSTAKVDLEARWEEWLDDVSRPVPVRVKGEQQVLELPIDLAWGDELLQAEIGANRLKHEFGDTHHRLVRYHLVATTRFREYFPPEITRDRANITRTGPVFHENAQILGLRVPNSARPLAPKPLYVVPSFKWSTVRSATKISSIRRGRGLRVWLERPWYSSGDGELLGVVLDERPVPAANATPAQKTAWLAHRDRVKSLITQRGKDPIFESANPALAMTAADFPLAAASGAGLSLDEFPAAQATFSVAGHAVEFDPERRLWFCDIEVNSNSSYFPFVRLALARYQPNSRADCHLSRVMLGEFSQLVPDRRVDVTIAADKRTLTVELYGVEPIKTGVTQGILTDPVPAGPLPKPPPPPERGGLNEFEFGVETLNPALGTDFGWQPTAGAVVTQTVQRRPKASKKGPVDAMVAVDIDIAVPTIKPLWKGTVKLPEPVGAKPFRLVAREFEMYYEDQADVFLGKRIARRLVYADTIEL